MPCEFYTSTNAFDRFLKYTNEKDVLAEILSMSLPKGSFLDVGAGDGGLADRIKHAFRKTVVVEPSERLASILLKKDYDQVIKSSLEDLKIKEKFDFVLCSHVLYYTADWEDSLEKLVSLTKKKGLACIITHAGSGGYHEMMDAFADKVSQMPFKVPKPEYIAGFFKEKGMKSFYKVVPDKITIPSADEALSLTPFMFRKNPADISESGLNELKAYFASRKDSEGRVVLYADHAVVWARK